MLNKTKNKTLIHIIQCTQQYKIPHQIHFKRTIWHFIKEIKLFILNTINFNAHLYAMILHHLKQAHGLNENSTAGSLMSVHYSSCEVDVTPQQDQYFEL